jgi:aspartate racemase
MKTIGMIGGTGWVSTLEYYRLLNEGVNQRLGGQEAARCILYSYNFADVTRLKVDDPEQHRVRELVIETAATLARVGAECLVLCANTLHMFAEDAAKASALPVIHIAEATALEIKKAGLTKVGLLGTRLTMEKDFYHRKLSEAGINALIPDELERKFIDSAIFEEMVRGIFRPEVKRRFLEIMDGLHIRGAEGIVMGCTEIPLLIHPEDTDLMLFDTLAIHARAAVDFALQDSAMER